jgi:hypothetical protein
MSAVVSPDSVTRGESTGRAVWATPDNRVAREQLPQEFPAETDLENEPEEEAPVEENYWEPRHIHVPRSIMWGVIALLSLGAAALAMWGLAHSTMTYGVGPVDAVTTARLSQIRTELEAAGAPAAALRYLDLAAQPGVNIGDAIDALAGATKALGLMSSNPTIAPLAAELHDISNNLSARRYGGQISASPTPLSILSTLTP